MFNFCGKKVLVTGAGRGIGRSIVKALAEAQCKVYALSKPKSSLDSLVQECHGVVPIVQDVSNWDETRERLENLENLDGLVNNAGISGDPLPSMEIPTVLDTNLLAAINCIQVVGKKMVQSNKPGSIVNISSVGAIQCIPNNLAYSVSKAALDMVTKQFALDLGPHNIRVNSVNPTIVDTLFVPRDVFNSFEAFLNKRTQLPGIPILPEEVASVVLFLLSDTSAMITGTQTAVDGGLLCNITI